jgi:hypothetical protein
MNDEALQEGKSALHRVFRKRLIVTTGFAPPKQSKMARINVLVTNLG